MTRRPEASDYYGGPDLRSSDARRRRMRAYLEARDGRVCGRCGDPVELGETASLGHIIPRSKGGTDQARNLRLEHLSCNVRAKDRDEYARIVEPAGSVDPAGSGAIVTRALGPVFQSGAEVAGMTRRVRNGAGYRPKARTIAIYRLDPVRRARIDGDGA